MCGICGELRFDQRAPEEAITRRMLQQLAKRGPDDEGIFHSGPAMLGHRRLSILDLSEKAHQPMVDQASGISIVFNGCIYNYPEIRKTLQTKGHAFNSTGDTEVILRAYLEWGRECVSRFNGMFAFAIWNSHTQTLFMARDRMGIKPFYYSLDGDRLRFASNLQALVATGDIDTGFDTVGLHNHFMLHAVVPAPNTVIKGIRKMRPGHWVEVNAKGEWKEERYWRLSAHSVANTPESEEEWIDAIHQSLIQAVKRRKEIADVPVGVLLSGGLDSSLLVALLAEAGVTNLKTFTVGFDDQPEEKGSEFEYSDPVAERYATEHHKFHVPNHDLITRLPEAVANMSEPMVGQDAVAFYLLSERVSKEVKVVQSGQGADEVFGGYFWYPQMHEAKGEADLSRFSSRYFDREHDEWQQMIQPKHHPDADVTSVMIGDLLAEQDADEYLNRVLAMDVTNLIVDDPVKRVDNMTMAWGLEARVPFLDHELVELAAAMPASLKLKEGGKYPLKAIARQLLPASVIDRPKGYFPVPALKYVRGEFLDLMRDTLNSQACLNRGLYQRNYVDALLAAPDKHHTRLQGSKLWHIALLELWMQTHIDAA